MNEKPRIGRRSGSIDGVPIFQVATAELEPTPGRRYKILDGLPVFARFKREIGVNTLHLGRKVPDRHGLPTYFVETGTDSPPHPGVSTPCCSNRIPLTLRWFQYFTTYPHTLPGPSATPSFTLNWTNGHTWSFTNLNSTNPNVAEEHREVRCDGPLLGFVANGFTRFTTSGGGGTTTYLYIRVDNSCNPFKLIYTQNFAAQPPHYHLIIP